MTDNATHPELHDYPTARLSVENVTKTFETQSGSVVALQDVSISIREGEFVCFVGPSGCGKSTLLNIIAGLEKPDRGKALINGAPITAPGRDRLVMFQEHLYLVKMDNFAHANIHELSGGMKQRVALARSLAPNPKILLMDEPFSALDAMTREQLYGDIQDIWQKRKKTIIFVTHNVREAVCLGDRVLLFTPHPGRIREEFKVSLPRLRNINDHDLADLSQRITAALKGYNEAGECD